MIKPIKYTAFTTPFGMNRAHYSGNVHASWGRFFIAKSGDRRDI